MKLTPIFDLSSHLYLDKYRQGLQELHSDFNCTLDETDLTITTQFKGVNLKTVPFDDGKGDIAFLLERKKHQDIDIKDLERIGATYSVESSCLGLDVIIFHVDPSKETISAGTSLDIPADKAERDKIVAVIKNDSAITIINDGATSDEAFTELQKGLEEINVKGFQYGPMWIEIEIEKPNTFGGLVNKIDGIRNSLLA